MYHHATYNVLQVGPLPGLQYCMRFGILHKKTFNQDGSSLPSRRLHFVSAPLNLLSTILFCRILSVSVTPWQGSTEIPQPYIQLI